jgi:hypothetical protein
MEDQACVGLRYRRTALYPSLHPGMRHRCRLIITIREGERETSYRSTLAAPLSATCFGSETPSAIRTLQEAERRTRHYDLRLP